MEFALSGVGVPPTNSRFREGLCLRREKSPALRGVPAGRDECPIPKCLRPANIATGVVLPDSPRRHGEHGGRTESPALRGVPASRDECKIGLGGSPKVCWAVSAQEKTYA